MSRSAWTLSAVQALNDAGSWTGRTHVHKLLFLADGLLGARQPFHFDLYLFGPYSFDLDSNVRELEAVGLLEKEFPKPDAGPKYRPLSGWERAVPEDMRLPAEQMALLKRAADQIKRASSAELEVIATCLWAEQRECSSEDAKIVDRVLQLKPRYAKEYVEARLDELRVIQTALHTPA